MCNALFIKIMEDYYYREGVKNFREGGGRTPFLYKRRFYSAQIKKNKNDLKIILHVPYKFNLFTPFLKGAAKKVFS